MGKVGKAVLAGAVAAAALLAPGSASAAVTFGADLSNAMLAPDTSGIGYAALTATDSGGTTETGSPVSGVMVSAGVRTTGAAANGFVRVLRPFLVANQFVNQGQEFVAVTADMEPGGHLTQVPTRVRIDVGDRIAAVFPGSVAFLHNDADAVYRCKSEPPAHAVGAADFYNVAGCGPGTVEVLVQGTVEPDADDDGFGDETQDNCAGTAGPNNGCPAPVITPPVATAVTTTPVTTAPKKCPKRKKLKRGKCIKKKKK